ncbi:MAG TPA: CPBP family intramembrane metalloprotease [Actinobacteria bacterium]|nr:CAAX amino terminal protease self- immunity [bacterium BMS3Bbin01]HDH25447.1 CPBP family intramembrane metalloprotease [Actinomycetota bacterium]
MFYAIGAPGLILAVWFQGRLSASVDVHLYGLVATGTLGLLTMALAWWFLRRDGIVLRSSPVARWLWWAILAVAGWVPLVAVFGLVAGRPVSLTFIRDGWVLPIQWLFVAPAEEPFYRGYLLHRLSGPDGRANGRGLVLSSIVFGFSHYVQRVIIQGIDPVGAMGNVLAVIAIGLALGWIYVQSSSIPLVAFVHGWSNAPAIGPTSDVLGGLWMLGWVVGVSMWRIVRQGRRYHGGDRHPDPRMAGEASAVPDASGRRSGVFPGRAQGSGRGERVKKEPVDVGHLVDQFVRRLAETVPRPGVDPQQQRLLRGPPTACCRAAAQCRAQPAVASPRTQGS